MDHGRWTMDKIKRLRSRQWADTWTMDKIPPGGQAQIRDCPRMALIERMFFTSLRIFIPIMITTMANENTAV